MGTGENYLRDVLPAIIERAREAKREAASGTAGTPANEFSAGRRMAYYEVVATMLSELDAFGIPRELVGVPRAFDPERELL